MARQVHKLSPRGVATMSTPGRHSDGGGLYLIVDQSGAKRWAFLFRWEGKLKEMGLGSFKSVSLAKARERAAAAREQVADGANPIAVRRAAELSVQTFGPFADSLVDDLDPQWRNAKHRQQWRMTLTHYAASLRPLPLDEIETDEVLAVLRPIWGSKPETASRLRARIERVLDAAKAKGLRSGENPARWRGHLDNLLPKRQKLSRGHHTALPYGKAAGFLKLLRARPAVAARALEFTILTAARSGEVLNATWMEIDIQAALWTVPAGRMKAGREHRVPLSGAAMAVLSQMQEGRVNDLVFPGQKADRPLSVMAMEMVLRRMKVAVTVHGFRSSFRDWAGEETDFPRELAEAALAHVVGDSTERAYRRGDAVERRRALMEAWAGHCAGNPAAADVSAGHNAERAANK